MALTLTPHVGDVGMVLRVLVIDENGVALNISSATTREILLGKPDDTVTTNVATFTTDGTDGLIQLTTTASTFDQTGEWEIQGHIIAPGVDWHTAAATFAVLTVLS